MGLRDTLTRLREQARQNDEAPDRPRLIEDWRQAVESLLSHIRLLLSDYDRDGLLSFESRRLEITEDALGTYTVEGMDIVAGPAKIVAEPVGRFIAGAIGRVDLYRQGNPAEYARVMLLRSGRAAASNAAPSWDISVPPALGVSRSSVLPAPRRQFVRLDRAPLERALDFLLA